MRQGHIGIALGAVAALALGGCIDEHHQPAHHAEHAEHYDEHRRHDVYAVAQPPPPAQRPANATEPGLWVWDPQRQQHLWVQP